MLITVIGILVGTARGAVLKKFDLSNANANQELELARYTLAVDREPSYCWQYSSSQKKFGREPLHKHQHLHDMRLVLSCTTRVCQQGTRCG